MTKRALFLLLCGALLLLCALSTRGEIFWFLFWVLGMMLLLSIVAVLWTLATLTVACAADKAQVTRGGEVCLSIDIRHMCPLPISALRIELSAMSEVGNYVLFVPIKPFVVNPLSCPLPCPHVGAFASGVASVRIEDVFGLFSLSRRTAAQQTELVVLPQVHLAAPLTFSPGESDNESMTARAFEDATMPADIRVFQQGDELKKVHWKLSMRRREMLVRVYEQPQRPDALLLVDCAPPHTPLEQRAAARDAICEAVTAVASAALSDGAPIRMPLVTDTPVEINAARPEELAIIRDALAHCPFDGAEEFERVLLLETRRMRRTGTTAIVTSHMSPAIADMILRIRRMGPKVRVLLAADAEEEFTAILVNRLMRNDVEVETVDMPA